MQCSSETVLCKNLDIYASLLIFQPEVWHNVCSLCVLEVNGTWLFLAQSMSGLLPC